MAIRRAKIVYALVQNINRGFVSIETSTRASTMWPILAVKPTCTLHDPSTNPAVRNVASVVPLTKEPVTLKKTDISANELEVRLSTGDLQLFDVRNQKELEESGKIPTAVNIPLPKLKAAYNLSPEEFEAEYSVKKPNKKDTNIVFYGRCEVKSLAALEIVHKLGYTKARHYPGGWDSYVKWDTYTFK